MTSKAIKIILTGATGMVGEGVLLECLNNSAVSEVLMLNRRHFAIEHPKLKELIVPDFLHINHIKPQLQGFDACFYCAGISSVGMNEADYTKITYDTTMHIARILKELNSDIVFNFVSGSHTDSTEQSKQMWARVKGRTENDLRKLFPDKQYNFRPALMKTMKGQRNLKGYNRYIKILYPVMSLFFPSCSLKEIAQAMIRSTLVGYKQNTLEVDDIIIHAKN
jgi:nucleoside-diphosphate-sugar epimerase